MQRGIATFTLDTGVCPPWLFRRMVKLGREMTRVIVSEYGPDEFVRRISDPVWFQALGTVLAFDWNASGLTTILTAALKEAIRHEEADLGIFICGGKGKTSRKTPDEILYWGSFINLPDETAKRLAYNSKMAAKVDSSLVQDDYQLYHHSFFFSKNGAWTVVQQGMNAANQTARRYHWHSNVILNEVKDLNRHSGEVALAADSRIPKDSSPEFTLRESNVAQNDKLDFVNEPHAAISSQAFQSHMLNMVAGKSEQTREVSTELAQTNYSSLMKDIQILRKHSSSLSKMITLKDGSEQLTLLQLADTEFTTHPVVTEDFSKSRYLDKILQQVTYEQPKRYEDFLKIQGVGPKTVRALALVSEIIYGAKPSYEDPARYSFAHGGKDATPYPVDRQTYDQTIATMQELVRKTRFNSSDKDRALRRLHGAQTDQNYSAT